MDDSESITYEESKSLLYSSPRRRHQHSNYSSWPSIGLAFVCGLLFSLATVVVINFAVLRREGPIFESASYDFHGIRPPLPRLTSGTDQNSQKPASWFSGPCGRSPSAAIAANCTLDLASLSWLPLGYLQDTDRADEIEFLNLRPWKYTFDQDRIQPIADLHALLISDDAPDRIFVDAEWHPIHCAYMFRRLQRKFAAGESVDGYIASESHAEHCSHMITDSRVEYDRERQGMSVTTRVFVKYPECV